MIIRNKRRFRRILPRVLGGLFAACALYAIFIEARWVEVVHVPLQLTRLSQGFDSYTIVQLSDIHYPRGFEDGYFQRIVQQTNALRPDLIVLTGDYAPKSTRDNEPCAAILGKLHAPDGVIAILGNHDHWVDADDIANALERQDIDVLRNESRAVTRGSQRLWVAGVDDAVEGKANMLEALRGVPARDAVIVLAHEPDFADEAARYPVDLMLAGHAHGGLVRLPFIGAPFLPAMSRKYPWGLRKVGQMYEYTNRGIGAIPIAGLPFRFNARPEITVFTLTARR